MSTPTFKSQDGFVLSVFTITVILVSLMLVAISSAASLNYRRAALENLNVNAQLTADAGLDEALVELTIDDSWSGSGGEVVLLNENVVRTTYETTVNDGATPNSKIISVTARSYSPGSSTDPDVTRRYEIDVEAVTSGTAPASVVSGVGGLILNNNAKISGGDVLVNGTIHLQNNSQIGLSTNPVNVRVAHQSCPSPPDSEYPRVCNSGEAGQPMSLNNNARVYGEVRATNQTNGNGMSDPGLIPGQTVDPISLPTYDRSAHPVDQTRNASEAGISCPNNNGNITWPADVKIIGSINMGNNCTVNITGNVWITGNLSTGNQGRIVVADSVGSTPPVIMIDGSSGFDFANNGRIIPNSSGTGVEIRTFWSDSTCSPDCTDLTGPELADSQDDTTIDLGNNGSAPNSVFISQWSRVRVSNNGTLGAVAGQSIFLSNQAVISFTAAVPGSDNLTTTWVKRGYMRVYQ